MKHIHYILDEDGTPVPEPDLLAWAMWLETHKDDRRVAKYERDGYCVSTIFLGLDHRFGRSGPPLLYETMLFDDNHHHEWPDGTIKETSLGHEMDDGCERYSTRDDAMIGHERFVRRLNALLDQHSPKALLSQLSLPKPE